MSGTDWAFADVAVDVPARELADTFSYAVPPALAGEVAVGATVLVPFARRQVVGYVLGVAQEPPASLAGHVAQAVAQVLAPSAFDEAAARVIRWMAREYACPLADAVHPFLAPGQRLRVERTQEGGPWQLVRDQAGPVDERWVRLADVAPGEEPFVPSARAPRQRAVLDALARGPLRMAELSALVPGAEGGVRGLVGHGAVVVERRRQLRGEEGTTLSSARAPRPEALTAGQRRALAAIGEARRAAAGDVVLVDGVTGSGKTEVYLEAIEECLAEGRGAIVLVPEIALTAQTLGRFRSRFGEEVAVLHSRLSAGERYDQWDLVRRGRARVVVGARSALFAPLPDVGLIVIDEEHESSYKQDSSPRYHARELAARLAAERGAALVLGSATPSLESLARCRAGSFRGRSWTRVEMPERPGGSQLPQVEVVDMGRAFRGGARDVFSPELAEALVGVRDRGEKAVLLLNRRGFATFLMCRECGCVPECPHCSVSLTYHERSHSLVCHCCGRSWPTLAYPNPATRCPNCGSRYLAAFGVGTQRVEDELRALLGPDFPVVRMDWDTTRAKGAHQRLLEEFDAAPSAVLVGTQMVAKGLDFPEVTLVGVVNADTMLKLPDFRASERTYDLLEQVAGRAGRGGRPGRVVVQSWWASHPAIQAAARHDRAPFEAFALAERQEAGYPPFSRLSNVVVWGRSERDVRAVSQGVADALAREAAPSAGWEVLGPAPCVRAKAKDRFRRHVLLKSPLDSEPGPALSAAVRAAGRVAGVSVAVDVDAYDLM